MGKAQRSEGSHDGELAVPDRETVWTGRRVSKCEDRPSRPGTYVRSMSVMEAQMMDRFPATCSV